MHQGLKLLLVLNLSSTAFMCVFHAATSPLRSMKFLFCSHKILYQPRISVVKHCAKSSISCITGSPSGNTPVWLISISKLKAHGMMSGSWFEVVHIQMGTKNKIKKNTQGDSITQWHTTKICTWKTWMRMYCGRPLYAHKPPHFCSCTHTHTLSKWLRVTVLISWLVTSFDYHVKAGLLTACDALRSILSSHLYHTTYPMPPPAAPAPPTHPPPPSP